MPTYAQIQKPIHVSGLALTGQKVVRGTVGRMIERRHRKIALVVVGAATVLATCLHGIEALIWALRLLVSRCST